MLGPSVSILANHDIQEQEVQLGDRELHQPSKISMDTSQYDIETKSCVQKEGTHIYLLQKATKIGA